MCYGCKGLNDTSFRCQRKVARFDKHLQLICLSPDSKIALPNHILIRTKVKQKLSDPTYAPKCFSVLYCDRLLVNPVLNSVELLPIKQINQSSAQKCRVHHRHHLFPPLPNRRQY